MSREPLKENLIENKFIEIKTDMRKGEVVIIHNYSNKKYAIKTLENVIKKLKE